MGGTENVGQFFRLDGHLVLHIHGDLHGPVANHLRDALVQPTNPTFIGVFRTNLLERGVRNLDLLRRDAGLIHVFADEVALGDLHLFLHRVAGNLDDLHPVAQCGLDGGEAVGGGEEHDLREVVVELEVVVVKRAVLFGVQNLEHGRGGVAVQVPAQLVDLVEDEERVGGARLLQVLDDPARHGADVGLAVAADFGFIPHAAEGHADILPAERLGDGLAERSLADARGAVQANDGGLHVALQLEYGEVLDDALLDLFQSIVVLIEDLLGVGEVEVVLGGDVPGQVEQEV